MQEPSVLSLSVLILLLLEVELCCSEASWVLATAPLPVAEAAAFHFFSFLMMTIPLRRRRGRKRSRVRVAINLLLCNRQKHWRNGCSILFEVMDGSSSSSERNLDGDKSWTRDVFWPWTALEGCASLLLRTQRWQRTSLRREFSGSSRRSWKARRCVIEEIALCFRFVLPLDFVASHFIDLVCLCELFVLAAV